MLVKFRAVVEDVGSDNEIRAIILTGAGRGFCSGANLLGGSGETLSAGGMGLRSAVMDMNDLLAAIAEMEKPWLAAVNGPAVGGGCALAPICDLVLAAEAAYLCVGYVNLARLVGPHKAKELAFFGDRVYGPQAAEMGLINRYVPDDALMETAWEWASRLANGPSLAIGAMKKLVNLGQQSTLRVALGREANMLSLISQTQDASEGILAFFQKRKPEFKGR